MSQLEQSNVTSSAETAAKRRALEKFGFLRHLISYLVVIGGLCAINLWTGASHLWFLWPALGWGIGLLAHAANVFVFSERVLQRMVDRELRRSSGPQA